MVQHRAYEEDHLRHLGRVSASVSTAAARDGKSIGPVTAQSRVAESHLSLYEVNADTRQSVNYLAG